MEEHEVNPDSTTYMLIIQSLTSVGNLESSIRLLVEMEEKGLSPRVETAEDIVSLAALQGNPRLAIDLALNFDASSARRLGPEIWIKCLVSSAENLYVSTQPKISRLRKSLTLNPPVIERRRGVPLE